MAPPSMKQRPLPSMKQRVVAAIRRHISENSAKPDAEKLPLTWKSLQIAVGTQKKTVSKHIIDIQLQKNQFDRVLWAEIGSVCRPLLVEPTARESKLYQHIDIERKLKIDKALIEQETGRKSVRSMMKELNETELTIGRVKFERETKCGDALKLGTTGTPPSLELI